ncbi:MAG: right-handed parallel beta-helix repeat-containing protein, partial [Armatimonadota bacterium]
MSTKGNDAWTGALAAPKAGGTDGPFATLERARDAIRALKKAGPLPAGGVCVQVRGGHYALAGAVKLTAEDAGTETAPIVYCPYPGEKVTITGAWPITGFVPDRGQIVKADVGAQGFKGVYFRQLFLDGKRQVLARYPNYDASNPHGGGFAYVDGEPLSMYRDLPEEELRVIHAKAPDARVWAHPEQGEVLIFPRYNWINMIVPIASADAAARTITLAKDISWGNFKGIRPLDRYYVRNLPEELDAPGEWYLDKGTWTLYYWPPRPLTNATVRAPKAETLFELSAKADWITLRGFTLEGCDGTAVALNGASHCLIAGNTIHDTGARLDGSYGVSVWGGRDCGVVGNDMYEICNYAIRLESDWSDRDTLTATGHYA